MPKFKSYFIKSDVTCVKLYANYILVGVGGYLHVFLNESKQLIAKEFVFDNDFIFGIIPNHIKNSAFIYGGTRAKIFQFDESFSSFNLKHSISFSDWILDARWINEYNNVATVSMHNRFQLWNQDMEKETEIECEEKCILYSALLTNENYKQVTVLSGTVFSEILIWKPSKSINRVSNVLYRLKGHTGVIFCIDYNPLNGIISSSSDDRSTILWKLTNGEIHDDDNFAISRSCQVFGHSSRVFRSQVLENYLLTVGEDSTVNIWSLSGNLVRKVDAFHGDSIWALDCDEKTNIIVTGCGDSGLRIFPLIIRYSEESLKIENGNSPKIIGYLKSGNLVVFSENGNIYLQTDCRRFLKIEHFEDLKSYALMEISICRNLVAFAGFHGQIYIFREENDGIHKITSYHTNCKSRIFSFHWLTCNIFLICQTNGKLTLFYIKENVAHPVSTFILPYSKERWTTTAAFVDMKVIVGDRKGNIYLFEIGSAEPKQILRKVHNHLGVTKVLYKNNQLISLGRNGILKIFCLTDGILELISSDKTPFTWLLNIVDDLLLAFSGNQFVICEYKTKRIIWETNCGGGHRSWDIHTSNNNISFAFVKDKNIINFNFDLNNIQGQDLLKSYHSKEINALKYIKLSNGYAVISGGEDTILRINLFKKPNSFVNTTALKSHLSSIRALALHEIDMKTFLIFSAGGRAQVICWKLQIGANHLLSCSEQSTYYRPHDREESEIRVMSLSPAQLDGKIILFCACSDGNVQLFHVDNIGDRFQLKYLKKLFYKLKCILKICIVNLSGNTVLISMATDGKIVFWNVTNVLCDTKIEPLFTFDCHQSGINSYSYKLLNNDRMLLLTGGDDNAIVLNFINFYASNSGLQFKLIDTYANSAVHCAQITGAFLMEDYFITASIDHRVTIFSWEIKNERLECSFITQYKTSIPDIQGLECNIDSGLDVFIYGKGLEVINIKNIS